MFVIYDVMHVVMCVVMCVATLVCVIYAYMLVICNVIYAVVSVLCAGLSRCCRKTPREGSCRGRSRAWLPEAELAGLPAEQTWWTLELLTPNILCNACLLPRLRYPEPIPSR